MFQKKVLSSSRQSTPARPPGGATSHLTTVMTGRKNKRQNNGERERGRTKKGGRTRRAGRGRKEKERKRKEKKGREIRPMRTGKRTNQQTNQSNKW